MGVEKIAAIATIVATVIAGLSFFGNNSGTVIINKGAPGLAVSGDAYAVGGGDAVSNTSVTVIDNSIVATGNSSVIVGPGSQINLNSNQDIQQ